MRILLHQGRKGEEGVGKLDECRPMHSCCYALSLSCFLALFASSSSPLADLSLSLSLCLFCFCFVFWHTSSNSGASVARTKSRVKPRPSDLKMSGSPGPSKCMASSCADKEAAQERRGTAEHGVNVAERAVIMKTEKKKKSGRVGEGTKGRMKQQMQRRSLQLPHHLRTSPAKSEKERSAFSSFRQKVMTHGSVTCAIAAEDEHESQRVCVCGRRGGG